MADESPTYQILTTIRDYIIEKGVEVPESKIYIARPNQSFIGEGPIICIYPDSPTRERYEGDANWWTVTNCSENLSIDVLVDDIYNDARESKALKSQLEIKYDLERFLYGGWQEVVEKLEDDFGIELYGYRPNNGEDYRFETDGGVMIGTVVPLTITRREDWARIPTKYQPVRHEVDFDIDKDGLPERELTIDETL